MTKEELIRHMHIFKSLGRDYFTKDEASDFLGKMTYSDLCFHKKNFEKELPKKPKVFHKYLNQLIIEKGVNNSQVWKEAGIDSSLFSKYLYNKRKPTMDNLLRIIFTLQLSEEEAIELMKLNGMSLDANNKRDFAFWYCIRNKFLFNETIIFLEMNHIVAFYN